ncbi:MAG: helix-hairpin-helix domain-containing protein [Spirochaetes bacterium]|nr:helix-hairpin-helix domain-containing protein [Spirochaetota bacterium]
MKIALILLLANSLTASFEYRETNPCSLFPYNYAVSDTNPLGNLSNPSYLPLREIYYVNTSYAKPYLMEELNSGNLRAGCSTDKLGVQAAWNRFGIRGYSEDVLEGSFGYRPWKFLSAGIGASYYHININTDEIKCREGAADFRFSALLLPYDWINIGYIQENIYSFYNRSLKNKDSDSNTEDFIYPNQSLGIALKPARGITFSWNINRIYYGYINSFSVTANMLSCLSLKGGYSRETSSYSFSANFTYAKFMVSYGLSHHAYLGATHKLGLSIAAGDLALEEINYNKSLYRRTLPEKKKKININECSLEELTESNLFTEEIAERVIKYREIIGPINSKGLIQIGIPKNEFESIREYLSGLAPETAQDAGRRAAKAGTGSYKIKTGTGYDLDTRKLLFQKLLENGLSAGTSLKISEHAKTDSKEQLIRKVKEMPGIDEEKKKIIIKICAESL